MKKQRNFSRNTYQNYWANERVQIDNQNGYGVSADLRSVAVKGFFNRITPSLFFSLAGQEPAESDTCRVVEMIESGVAIASPALYVDVEGFLDEHSRRLCKVVGCDGLGACAAMQRLGVEELDVPFILLGRTMRDIGRKSDFFNWLSHGVVPPAGRSVSMPIKQTII